MALADTVYKSFVTVLGATTAVAGLWLGSTMVMGLESLKNRPPPRKLHPLHSRPILTMKILQAPCSSSSKPQRVGAVGFRMRGHRTVVLAQKLSDKQQKITTSSEEANILVRLTVSAATEALRLLGIGSSPSSSATINSQLTPEMARRPAINDVSAVLDALKSDYQDRAYFVTGVLSDGIYDEDCYFADPTVSFRGRELWKRNLQLLVPFLEAPSIDLIDLQQIKAADEDKGAILRADWVLRTGLKLPWKPYVVVNGSTEYELAHPDNNRIIRHIEAWDISGVEALKLVFTPGRKGGGS